MPTSRWVQKRIRKRKVPKEYIVTERAVLARGFGRLRGGKAMNSTMIHDELDIHELETETSAASSPKDWSNFEWKKMNLWVQRIQQRIYRAEKLGQRRRVKGLQRMLMRSESALLISIRQVTQLNKGKRTAGVDGFKALTPVERMNLFYKMKGMNLATHNPSPAKRVEIPKDTAGKKLRPLGIPIIIDRIYQNIVKLALEPQWEVHFESTSYGFRPKRGCHDAISAIFSKLKTNSKKKWIFEGDFKGCFDNLDHDYIMEQIKEFPYKEIIRKWLKAGFIHNGVFNLTESGTPQGGIISPLLANIALHGMEEEIGVKYQYRTKPKTKGKEYYWTLAQNNTVSVVRYADDFVIMTDTKEEAERMYEKLKPYLLKRGLELAPEKTKVVHATEGFDFLGFNIRHYATAKEKGNLWKLLIKPSKKSIAKATNKIRACFEKNKGYSVAGLITELLPIIRGYANYWKTVSSKEIFSEMDNYIYKKTKKFLSRLHPNKSWKWIKKRYFKPDKHGVSKDNWLLTDPTGKYQIIKMTWTPIIKHKQIIFKNSPFDVTLKDYYLKRNIEKFENDNVQSRQKLAKKQKFYCPMCNGLLAGTDEALETHHKKPKIQGGGESLKNKWLVHQSCHIQYHINFPAKKPVPTELVFNAWKLMMTKRRINIESTYDTTYAAVV